MTRGLDRTDIYRRWMWFFVVLIGAGCVVGIAVPAGLGWDFANFYDAGRRVATGQAADLYSPRSPISGQPPQGTTGFFGAPLSALFYAPLAAFGAETALVLFKIQNVIASAATYLVLLTFYRPFVAADRQAQSRFAALFAFLFLIYQPFWTVFRVGGQTTATVLLLVSLGLVAHTSGRMWRSAICVVLAALIKPALAPMILVLVGVSGLAYAWRMGAVLLVVGVLSLLLIGWPAHAAFLDLMARSSQLTSAWYYNSSLYVLVESLRRYVGPEEAAGSLRLVWPGLTYALKGAVVVTVLRVVLRSRRERWSIAARRHFDFSIAVVFFLVWSPTVWEHYLSLLFPFLIYIVANNTSFTRQALSIVALIFAVSVGQNLIFVNWLRYGFAFDSLPAILGVTVFKSAPLLLTMMLLWRHAGELLQSHASPAWQFLLDPLKRAPA